MVPASASRLRRGYPGMLSGRPGVAPVNRRRVVRPLPPAEPVATDVLYWYVAADLALGSGSPVTSWPSHLSHGPTLDCTDTTTSGSDAVAFGATSSAGGSGNVPSLRLTNGITIFVVGVQTSRTGTFPIPMLSDFDGADYGFMDTRFDTPTATTWLHTENYNSASDLWAETSWQLNVPDLNVVTCAEAHLTGAGHTLRVAGVDQAPRLLLHTDYSGVLQHTVVSVTGTSCLVKEVRVYDGTPDLAAVRAELAATYGITA